MAQDVNVANLLNNNINQALQQALQLEISYAEQMLSALNDESDALGTHEPEKLEAATQIKHHKMQLLEQAGKERDKVLASTNSQPPFTETPPLNSLWTKLMKLAEQCQQLNRVNGCVIERGYQQSRHALDILHGLDGTANTLTKKLDGYNQNGQTTYSSRSRSIAQV